MEPAILPNRRNHGAFLNSAEDAVDPLSTNSVAFPSQRIPEEIQFHVLDGVPNQVWCHPIP